jgi:hypothetical protein
VLVHVPDDDEPGGAGRHGGAGASGFAQDAKGSLYVIGSSREGMTGSRWVVRKLACQ